MMKRGRAPSVPPKDMDIDMELGADPITTSLPSAGLAGEDDDPMADPEIDSADEQEGDGEEASDLSELEEDEEDVEDVSMSGGATLSTVPTPTATLVNGSAVSDAGGVPHSSIYVTKPIPYTIDAGHLLITDPNPLPPLTPSNIEATLLATARDAAQTLLNHLLSTCPIISAPSDATGTSSSGVEMTLPAPIFALPREKRIPTPKAPTKWEAFAAKKGIGKNVKKGQEGVDQEGRLRAGKMVYDEATGEWKPKYGYKGKNKEEDWIVEVDDKIERKKAEGGGRGKIVPKGIPEGSDPAGMKRAERKERVKRNERLQRANDRRARAKGV